MSNSTPTFKLRTLSVFCSCIFLSLLTPLKAVFLVPSIQFPIKLNSLLTGMRRVHEGDRICMQCFLKADNSRSLHSKSVCNGVWTRRISSVYLFYLFLICINGNSVSFNLYDGRTMRSNWNVIGLFKCGMAIGVANASNVYVTFFPGALVLHIVAIGWIWNYDLQGHKAPVYTI